MSEPLAKTTVLDGLEEIYKRASTKVKNFKRMNWPAEPWALASYSFPKCGDIMRWGPKFSEGYRGKLHFAGEHACYAFTGYMEGALQSMKRCSMKRKSTGYFIRSSSDCARTKTLEEWSRSARAISVRSA